MDKKLLLAIALSLLTVWGLQHFTGSQSSEQGGPVAINAPVAPGQPIKVLSAQDLYKQLNTTVVLDAGQAPAVNEKITVATPLMTAVFCTEGGVLEQLDFNKHKGKGGKSLRTIASPVDKEHDKRISKQTFLLAFDQQTPTAYKLVRNETKDGVTNIAFQTETMGWTVTKQYAIHADAYRVDVTLGFVPASENVQPLHPRLFVKAPYVDEVAGNAIHFFDWNEYKTDLEQIELGQHKDLVWYWQSPKVLFGAQDKYFVHALVNDAGKFVQRAYINAPDKQAAMAIFEGPTIQKAQQWELTFYMGPKVSEQLSAVDERLERLLSFGWLSLICRLLLGWLMYLYQLLGNFGLAIILLTLLLKLPFMPLSMYARKKTEEYQKYMPTINKIRLKYRHDMQMQHNEVMRFHQEHNISPTTQMLGCLPLLIQIPIFFGLYRVLNNYVVLYQAPFYGWITDLSARDPFYIIPVLMCLVMLWQNFTTPQTDEKQRVIAIFMSIVVAVVSSNLAAGLVLYGLANIVFSLGEDSLRKLIFRK